MDRSSACLTVISLGLPGYPSRRYHHNDQPTLSNSTTHTCAAAPSRL
jgi:hypothetical protein